jgi:hypothetical protein
VAAAVAFASARQQAAADVRPGSRVRDNRKNCGRWVVRDSEFAASSRSQPPGPQGESTFPPQLLMRYNFALGAHIFRTADRKVGGGIQHCLHIIFCTISNWPPPHAHNSRRFWGTPGSYLNFS